MKYDPEIHHRRSIRLEGYDYSQSGYYFITICTHGKESLFGTIEKDAMDLNDAGKMIQRWWNELINKFANIKIDEYVMMPNHFHGVIYIVESAGTGQCDMSVGADLRVCPIGKGEHTGSPLRPDSINTMIQWFKTMTTNEYIRNVKQNRWKPFDGKLWQRNYYEHIIRDETSLGQIREYIVNNPRQWQQDELFAK